MSLFVLKPHVTGPEGNVTSPDVIVDKLFVDGQAAPLARLTHEAWQEVASGETTQPAYEIMALGGGALILPTIVLSSGIVVVSRQAWRLNNLEAHMGEVTLNGQTLDDIGSPECLIAEAGGTNDALPRGFMLVKTSQMQAQETLLDDPKLNRSLTHSVVLQDIATDPWGGLRPKPRYSVGPTQKDVAHFI